MFKKTKLFFLGLSALGTASLYADMHCKVINQKNIGYPGESKAKHPLFKSIQTVHFDQKYRPLNVSVNGTSLNEYLLGSYEVVNREEIEWKSKNYIKAQYNKSSSLDSFSMTNDWDTYKVEGKFLESGNPEDHNHFIGVMTLRWDDTYSLFLDCEKTES